MKLKTNFLKVRRNIGGGDESGSALIVVVSLIALASVLAASAIVQAHKSTLLSSVFLKKCFTGYVAEGASARIEWLISNDRRKFPQRVLGASKSELESDAESGNVRFIADAVYRTMNYYGSTVSYRILDMASGIDISGPNAVSNLELLANQYENENLEEYRVFINKFEDYVDSNDLIRIGSIESDGYRELGLFPLPRNSRMEFKEEILWIPGASKFFPPDKMGRLSILRTIPPKNMPRPPLANNFFSSEEKLIKSSLNLTDAEAEQVFEARKRWTEEGSDLSLLLDVGLLTRIRSKFSFNESGYYKIEINGRPDGNRADRRLLVSLKISNVFTNPGIRYYEWFSY